MAIHFSPSVSSKITLLTVRAMPKLSARFPGGIILSSGVDGGSFVAGGSVGEEVGGEVGVEVGEGGAGSCGVTFGMDTISSGGGRICRKKGVGLALDAVSDRPAHTTTLKHSIIPMTAPLQVNPKKVQLISHRIPILFPFSIPGSGSGAKLGNCAR